MAKPPPQMDELPAQALARAVDLLGGQAAMARLLKVSQPSVFGWIKRGKGLPADHALAVEAATGVSKHDLRPNIYPRDRQAAADHAGHVEAAR